MKICCGVYVVYSFNLFFIEECLLIVVCSFEGGMDFSKVIKMLLFFECVYLWIGVFIDCNKEN